VSLQTPGFKLDSDGRPDPNATEQYAEEARYFTESRILQQNVNIIFESVNGQNFVGSVIHPVSTHLGFNLTLDNNPLFRQSVVFQECLRTY